MLLKIIATKNIKIKTTFVAPFQVTYYFMFVPAFFFSKLATATIVFDTGGHIFYVFNLSVFD